MKTRAAFVLLLTEAALASFWVNLEMQTYLGLMAQERSRLLLPVRIGPCAAPPMLNAFFWIDAQALPFERTIDAIATAFTMPGAPSAQPPVVTSAPPHDILLPLGPAPAPAHSAPALHLTPTTLYNLGFRGYSVKRRRVHPAATLPRACWRLHDGQRQEPRPTGTR